MRIMLRRLGKRSDWGRDSTRRWMISGEILVQCQAQVVSTFPPLIAAARFRRQLSFPSTETHSPHRHLPHPHSSSNNSSKHLQHLVQSIGCSGPAWWAILTEQRHRTISVLRRPPLQRSKIRKWNKRTKVYRPQFGTVKVSGRLVAESV